VNNDLNLGEGGILLHRIGYIWRGGEGNLRKVFCLNSRDQSSHVGLPFIIIIRFRRGVVEAFALLRSYAA